MHIRRQVRRISVIVVQYRCTPRRRRYYTARQSSKKLEVRRQFVSFATIEMSDLRNWSWPVVGASRIGYRQDIFAIELGLSLSNRRQHGPARLHIRYWMSLCDMRPTFSDVCSMFVHSMCRAHCRPNDFSVNIRLY